MPSVEKTASDVTRNNRVPAMTEVAVASAWSLMWWKFKAHRLAVVSGGVLIIIYLTAIFASFLSPYDPYARDAQLPLAPPQIPRFISEDGFRLRPFVYGYDRRINPETLRRTYTPNRDLKHQINFFVRGHSHKLFGLWETDIRLFGVESGTIFLLGTDRQGRDMLSRILYGSRVSVSIGLVGVFLSLLIGVLVGGFSGYFGGVVDDVSQRVIETLRSMPTIPLWMGLSAAVPVEWSQLQVYLGITVILSLIGWTDLARVVRSKFLSLREEDFVLAARLCGAREVRIVLRHMIPSFMSHIIASVTLAIPSMILAETALSFLGLGLRPPTISWGVLLIEAQNIRTVAQASWLLLPGLFVIVTVLAFNFLGDGMRDAADPFSTKR